MKDNERRDVEEAELNSGPLPDALERLCDAMHGIDAEWNLEGWLIKRAEQEIELIKADLEREKLKLEQKMYRVESLSKRITPDVELTEKGQKNLFDCFDLVGRAVAEPHVQSPNTTYDPSNEPHPVMALLDYLPGEISDDPLLAVAAQLVLIEIDKAMAKDADMVSHAELVIALADRGISNEELNEAIDHLLTTGAIHEVEDDCFIVDE